MSTKIAKLISSALNNSSANEAAQALKLAAITMQKEGVNPSSFLSVKGEESESSSDNEELREAKLLAIKWHRAYKEQAEELEQALTSASLYQKGFVSMLEKKENFKKWFKWSLGAAVIGAVLTAGLYQEATDAKHELAQVKADRDIYSNRAERLQAELNAELNGTSFDAQVNKQEASKATPAPKAKPAVWHPRGGVYGMAATCQRNGKIYRPEFNVNINEHHMRETTDILKSGYNAVMPDEGAPMKGYQFDLTYNASMVYNCIVSRVWE